jgi:hypothetical protein
MKGQRIVILEDFEFNGKTYEKRHQFTITDNDDIRGLSLEDDFGNTISEIRFSGIKWQLLSQYRDDRLRGLYI